MKRITIITIRASADLLDRLRAIAQHEQVSMAEVIRQGLELRAAQAECPPLFIGAGEPPELPHTTGRLAGETTFSPPSYRTFYGSRTE